MVRRRSLEGRGHSSDSRDLAQPCHRLSTGAGWESLSGHRLGRELHWRQVWNSQPPRKPEKTPKTSKPASLRPVRTSPGEPRHKPDWLRAMRGSTPGISFVLEADYCIVR